MAKRKIYLVTGCAGFIGSHVTEALLNSGNKVIGIDNFDPFYSMDLKKENLSHFIDHSRFNFFEGDISDKSSYTNLPKEIDVVIHLAAKAGVRPSIENPDDYLRTNIIGTKTILDWMCTNKIKKMVFGSSSSVYGNNPKVPFEEEDKVDHPISPYAFSKKSAELLNHLYHHLYDIDIINLRFFTVYGPRQRPDLAIRKFIQLIQADQPITLYGDGSTSRDYTFIDDIVVGILAASNYILSSNKVFETINIGNSQPIKLIELADIIYKVLNKSQQINYLPMQDGDVNKTFADISKARKLLGYNPQISMKEGIINFIAWMEKQSLKTLTK